MKVLLYNNYSLKLTEKEIHLTLFHAFCLLIGSFLIDNGIMLHK